MQTYLHEITVFNFIVGEAKGGMLPVLWVLAVSQDRNLKTSPEMVTEPGALAGVAGKHSTTKAPWVLAVSQERNQKR